MRVIPLNVVGSKKIPADEATTPNDQNIQVDLPIGVVIGDSIAEGRPETQGRLNVDRQPCFRSDFANMPGQLSYFISRATGLLWYNHGIGGQRTDQIWHRWRRDVLGQSIDPGDGRSPQTLPYRAHFAIIIAGINDVFQNKDDDFICHHLTEMARSAQENGIVGIFANLGEHNAATMEQREQIQRINAWIEENIPIWGGYVVDMYDWSMDRSRGWGVRPDYYVDDVHPSKAGFEALSRFWLDQLQHVPLYATGLQVEASDPIVKLPIQPLALDGSATRMDVRVGVEGISGANLVLSGKKQLLPNTNHLAEE